MSFFVVETTIKSYIAEHYQDVTRLSCTILGECQSGCLRSDPEKKHVLKICNDYKERRKLQARVAEDPFMEIYVLQKISNKANPYFVELIKAIEDGTSLCIILEFVNGGTVHLS